MTIYTGIRISKSYDTDIKDGVIISSVENGGRIVWIEGRDEEDRRMHIPVCEIHKTIHNPVDPEGLAQMIGDIIKERLNL